MCRFPLAFTESVEEKVGKSLDKERARHLETVKKFSKLLENSKVGLCMTSYVGLNYNMQLKFSINGNSIVLLNISRLLQILGEVNAIDSKSPGEGIVQAATEIHASFIVTGTRGLGKVRRTILGSVSDYILRHAPMPVVVCKYVEKKGCEK